MKKVPAFAELIAAVGMALLTSACQKPEPETHLEFSGNTHRSCVIPPLPADTCTNAYFGYPERLDVDLHLMPVDGGLTVEARKYLIPIP